MANKISYSIFFLLRKIVVKFFSSQGSRPHIPIYIYYQLFVQQPTFVFLSPGGKEQKEKGKLQITDEPNNGLSKTKVGCCTKSW
jgi:hypothetical protein